MTTPLQTTTSTPIEATGEATGGAVVASRFPRGILLGVLFILAIFAVTYAYAWYQANALTTRFIENADANFQAGNYLDALVGKQEFDTQLNKYVTRGGYVSVEKIWSSPSSWPIPPAVQRARERSQEIINQKLTIEQAEAYIQANTGRPGAPYFGDIYLRLGELYEQNGDVADARDVYSSMASLFPNRPDLIEKANQHLAKLDSQTP